MKNWELQKILKENGFDWNRSKGDHHIWTHPRAKRPVVLSGDNGTEVSKAQKSKLRKQIKGITGNEACF